MTPEFVYSIAHDLSVVVGFASGCVFWLMFFYIIFGGGRR